MLYFGVAGVAAVFGVAMILSPISGWADACEWDVDLTWQITPSNASRFTAISSMAMKRTVTVQGVTFNSNYDNGSIFSVAGGGGNVFNLELFEESGEIGLRKYQFRFTMTGDIVERTLTINLEHPQIQRPFVRFKKRGPWGPWRRMTKAESPNLNQMILTAPQETTAMEVAFYEPLSLSETHERIALIMDEAATDASITSEVIGKSFQGRDLHMITITDPTIPNTTKQRVWMHARAHAGEVTSSHSMLGFLAQSVEDSDLGRRLRRNLIIHVIPTLNADGTWLGLTRWDSQGIDPERQWPNPNRIPETAALKRLVDEFMASPNPIRVALNMHSTVGFFRDSFFFKHVRPSVTIDKEIIVQRYIDALRNASPIFDNLSPATSQLSPTLFIESYFWNNWGPLVMAVTHEGHYYQRIDGADMTGTDYFNLGKHMAEALVEYFNLPLNPAKIDDWSLYN